LTVTVRRRAVTVVGCAIAALAESFGNLDPEIDARNNDGLGAAGSGCIRTGRGRRAARDVARRVRLVCAARGM
jgi:hypothetical protein